MIKIIVSAMLSMLIATSLKAQKISPTIKYFDEKEVVDSYNIDMKHHSVIEDKNGCKWLFSFKEIDVKGSDAAKDYEFRLTLEKGSAKEVAFFIDFEFDNWNSNNYVFVPAAVYDGNKFDVKQVSYPPYWYDPQEWREDMPTTTTLQPSLNLRNNKRRIELTTGCASTPLMAFFAPNSNMSWMIQTYQGNQYGNYGMYIDQNDVNNSAMFSISSPSIRENRASGSAGLIESEDKAIDLAEGESITIKLRTYKYDSNSIQDMMNRFVDIRKDLNESSRREVLPYSEAWKLINNLYQESRWDENIDMYWLSKVRPGNVSWNFVWQLGWCGGGQSTLPIIMNGSVEERNRAIRNIEAIYSRTQAPSGFFYAYGNGKEFTGFGYGVPLKNNETFVRSQGDWLYMSQKQFNLLQSMGLSVSDEWKSGTKKQADAFVKLWNKYGQFGQFVNVESGDLCIGGSTAGAIVPAGLALASETYNDPSYMDVAKSAARKYYNDYVLKGYTTGGPGEILSAPDSESAFALMETFMVLYEKTKDNEWLKYAADLLPICASWTVSYDYKFPDESPMGKIDARSCGSVWASVANKHSAPAACTSSGIAFLNYYRATGDKRSIELVRDIAHGITQYISREDCKVGDMPPGGICERVNLSDWESKSSIGGNIFESCSWCEVAVMHTVSMLPGVYISPDKGEIVTFDNVQVKKISQNKKEIEIAITNPTKFDADVKIYVENSSKLNNKFSSITEKDMQVISIKSGEVKVVCLKK